MKKLTKPYQKSVAKNAMDFSMVNQMRMGNSYVSLAKA